MTVLIVIPARYESSRFPGKPLVPLRGADGQEISLIERSWRAAMGVSGVTKVVVATDDDRIRTAAEAFGAEVVMTPESCSNGTERTAAALDALGGAFDVVVNFQGDAPLTPAWFVEDLIAGLRADPGADMATPVLRCDGHALNGFLSDRLAGRVGGTTAVFGLQNRALFFSKEVIPYTGMSYKDTEETPVFHHVGVYAFRPDVLRDYPIWPSGPLEKLEGLEQLRFLEHGRQILCVEVDAKGSEFWELNNPEDVPRIESILAKTGMK